MKIPPKTHLLSSFRSANPRFELLCGEAVDNSLDASATEVAIKFGDDAIIIQDNGNGITRARYEALATIGSHAGMPTTALGRHGIGIKFQAMAASPILAVDSISVEGRLRGEIDWDDILRKGTWETDDPQIAPIGVGSPKYTYLTLRYPKKIPTDAAVEKIRGELSKMFHPALRDGVKIKVDGVLVGVLPEPKMTDVVEREVRLADDQKYFRVHAGILVDPKSRLRQVHLSYKHRVIMAQTSFGCGIYSSHMIFCRVELFGPWTLSQFKDDIGADEKEELSEALFEILEPLLEKSRCQNMSMNIDKMTTLLNAMVPDELKPTQPPKSKNPQGRFGKKLGKKSTTKHAAEKEGPSRVKKKPRDTLLIDFVDGLHEEYGYGRFDEQAAPMRVELAKDNPRIDSLLNVRDKDVDASKLSLFEIAAITYLTGRAQKDLFDEKFGLILWRLVSGQEAAAMALKSSAAND